MTRTLILTSTFLSAFLLFIIQPLYAKYLLPFFGGTSSVWTISIFFYSVTLLLGYIYASLLTSWPSRTARYVHGTLLVLAGALLLSRWLLGDIPLLVQAVVTQSPAVSVLLTLLLGVGLPVLLLASTSVIVQHLYARSTARDPYALFALSNAGSLIGLAIYPFVFEPFTNLPSQSAWWSIGFVVFIILLISGWRQVDIASKTVVQSTKSILQEALRHRGLIVFMAAIPTFLLASSTELLSKGIASFPLMWVIPLMLYLISFIVSFGNRISLTTKIPFGFWVLMSMVPVFAFLPILNTGALEYWVTFIFVMISFFMICTYFHSRVYYLRPRVDDLGPFYVYMTFGGALGSGVVGLLLPFILNDQIEMYVVFGMLAVYLSLHYLKWLQDRFSIFLIRGLQVIVAINATIFVVSLSSASDAVVSQRNFYGTLKVIDSERMVEGNDIPVRLIVNGSTNHGLQALDERYNTEAASYYGPDSGIDIAVRRFVEAGTAPRLNVIGLGAGMVNTYCDRVSNISYIEINPAVEQLAHEYFTYLEMCPEKTSVQTGDGRLLLEEEVKKGNTQYDVIVVDAFTDDAIPSHLLTTEAFSRAYEPLLSEQGVVAFHISNRYLNLFPPIAGMARDNEFDVVVVSSLPEEHNSLHSPTVWVLVSRPENIENLLSFKNAKRYEKNEIVWTDYQNSVMTVLSWSGSKGKD